MAAGHCTSNHSGPTCRCIVVTLKSQYDETQFTTLESHHWNAAMFALSQYAILNIPRLAFGFARSRSIISLGQPIRFTRQVPTANTWYLVVTGGHQQTVRRNAPAQFIRLVRQLAALHNHLPGPKQIRQLWALVPIIP